MRELVLVIYGGVLGWYLCRWYQSERESLMWQIKHEAEIAALKAREVLPDAPPAAEAATA